MLKSIKHPDYILAGVSCALVVLGMLVLLSVSASLSLERFGNTYHFVVHQLLFGLAPGLILAVIAFRINLKILKKWSPLILLINLALLGMVFLPKIGLSFGGASRWLNLGVVSFQPSEFLKLSFILYLGSWLIKRTSRRAVAEKVFSQTLISFLIILGSICLILIFQKDTSTLGIIVFLSILMYFFAGTPIRQGILIASMAIIGLLTLIKLSAYRLNRFLVFLNPDIDPMGIGYHLKQALIVIGSGGIFGLGLGMSSQKFGFFPLPQSISDSIFAVFAEETGFLGAIFLIFLFLLFLKQGLKITKLCQDKFFGLVSLGISSWIVVQAFINISSMLGVLPLTGVPLPFISYGGSHIIAELTGTGILLNISKNV